MRPVSLHNVAAPSPNVLRFLRALVQGGCDAAPAARCAVTGQSRRWASTSNPSSRGGVKMQVVSKTLRNSIPVPTPSAIGAERSCLFSHGSAGSRPIHDHRAFTTTSWKDAWNILGSRKRQKGSDPSSWGTKSPLAKVIDDGSGFNGLGRTARPANELKMRCTELDENGNVTMVSGEFKKSELIAKYGLLPRDLRKIDSSLLPHILVRPSAILINLLHLRVLIKHNRVLVFDAYGTTASQSQSVFMYDLDLKLRQKESPATGSLAYEFRALEAVLISVTLGLEKEFESVSEPVVRVLAELEEDIDRDKLRYLLVYSKKLGSFGQKARLVRDAMTELLEADDDLSAMYLSEKAAGKTREEDDHTEVEMLLESYHKVADEICQAAENLESSIRNTEEIVRAILDANRNSLMLLDLKFSILTLSITAGTFVAALYGMNLKNFIEESDLGFFGISAWCTVFGLMVATFSFTRLRKVQRVSMWGHGPGSRTGAGWGLGAWGGRSTKSIDGSLGLGREGLRIRPGESLGELLQRERENSKRLAKAEAKTEEALRF